MSFATIHRRNCGKKGHPSRSLLCNGGMCPEAAEWSDHLQKDLL